MTGPQDSESNLAPISLWALEGNKDPTTLVQFFTARGLSEDTGASRQPQASHPGICLGAALRRVASLDDCILVPKGQ